jgi:hypothetical protein
MGKNDESGAEFTPDKIKLYEEFLQTGRINGKTITNQFEIAREIGTSVGRINKWHQEQNQLSKLDKEKVEQELEVLQKKTQNKLTETIVKVALVIILTNMILITAMYVFAMINGYEIKIIESTWSNMVGILLTNSFTIVSTIMGVKYASKTED